jgi:hypothetical protein
LAGIHTEGIQHIIRRVRTGYDVFSIMILKSDPYTHQLKLQQSTLLYLAAMAPSKTAKAKPSTKATKQQPTTKPSSQSSPPPPPNWPAFKPRLPVVDITPELHPDSPTTIAVIRTFFPRGLCQDYVGFLRTLSFQTTPTRPKKGEALRFNDRFQVDDAVFAGRLWVETGLREACSSDPELHRLW